MVVGARRFFYGESSANVSGSSAQILAGNTILRHLMRANFVFVSMLEQE
jgi:hypothetical protein